MRLGVIESNGVTLDAATIKAVHASGRVLNVARDAIGRTIGECRIQLLPPIW